MIEFMPETKGNVVGIRATGTLPTTTTSKFSFLR